MAEELGPVVGEQVSDFTLPDDSSKPLSLQETMGAGGVLLTFIHGVWCSACVQAIYRLQRYANIYADQGVGVAIVAIDPPHRLSMFKLSARLPIAFPLLADEGREVHERYRLEQVGAYLLIDAAGVLRHKFLDLDHRGWPGHFSIQEAIQQMLS